VKELLFPPPTHESLSLVMPRSVFRPCIDLHNGQVKQIVGGTLDTQDLRTNFVSAWAILRLLPSDTSTPLIRLFSRSHRNPSEFYAKLYRENGLTGGHVIKLGPGNDDAARAALKGWKSEFSFFNHFLLLSIPCATSSDLVSLA